MKALLAFLLILANPTPLINPKVPDGSPFIVKKLILAGQVKQSQEEPIILGDVSPYQEEVRKYPNSPEAYYNLGRAYLSKPFFPDLIKARKAFKRAIELKPEYAEAYNILGISYQGFQFGLVIYGTFYEKAVEAHKKAIDIRPDYAEAYLGLGRVHFALGQFEQSIEALRQAINLKIDYEEAHEQLQEVQQAIERLKKQ